MQNNVKTCKIMRNSALYLPAPRHPVLHIVLFFLQQQQAEPSYPLARHTPPEHHSLTNCSSRTREGGNDDDTPFTPGLAATPSWAELDAARCHALPPAVTHTHTPPFFPSRPFFLFSFLALYLLRLSMQAKNRLPNRCCRHA